MISGIFDQYLSQYHKNLKYHLTIEQMKGIKRSKDSSNLHSKTVLSNEEKNKTKHSMALVDLTASPIRSHFRKIIFNKSEDELKFDQVIKEKTNQLKKPSCMSTTRILIPFNLKQ